MKILEIIAVVFGILSVWYARKEDIKVFPTGIISVLIFIYLFFVGRMYANAGINVIYVLTNVYGWYNWSRKNENESVVKISKNTPKQNLVLISVAVVFYVGVFLLLRWTNSDDLDYIHSSKPWMDALNSTIFLCATLLMTVKKLENWYFWLAGNIISIPIFIVQGYYFTAFQYVVFLVLAISGLNSWKKKEAKNE
ncbi:MAG: nicotinamide riboside transporter PnuC [Paludibacteraceae bacterium]